MLILNPTAPLARKNSRRPAFLRGASGKGMFRAFAWLAVLVTFGYVCSALIPVYFDNYQLQDAMQNEVRFAVVEHKDQNQIQEDVYRKAKSLGVPARMEGITVEPIQGGYRITVDYTVPLRIFDHEFDLRFHTTADNSSI